MEVKQKIQFQWVTSLEVTRRNLEEMILARRGNNKIVIHKTKKKRYV